MGKKSIFASDNLSNSLPLFTLAPVQERLNESIVNMPNIQLKYPRRTKRTIEDNTFELFEPTDEVSEKMQKIASSNTKIEILFENELKKHNINYSKPKDLIEPPTYGNPDFVLPRLKIAIFCDGDFWHGYNLEKHVPKSNSEFWLAKINSNIQRDKKTNEVLRQEGWKVFRFWEHEIKKDVSECFNKVREYIKVVEPQKDVKFTFVDLFAGIGGFRIALDELGGKCLGFSEIDKQATQVYKKNFFGFTNEKEVELGDITKLSKLPFNDIDLIVGGVPCQSWSVAGKMRGFDDPRGRLWHDSIRVVEENKPKAFIFENVKGLMDPRNKANLDLILESLKDLGYQVKAKLLNSYDFGLPQNRERIFIVGIRTDLLNRIGSFEFPKAIHEKINLKDIIEGLNEHISVEKKVFDPFQIFGDKIPMGRNRFQKTNEFNDFFVFCDTRNGHTSIHSWDIIRTSEREKEICMIILRNRRKKIYGPADGNPLSFETLKNLIPNLKESELIRLVEKRILRLADESGYEFVNSKNSAGINGIYRVYLPESNIFSTLTATGTKDMVALKSVQGSTPEEYRQNFIDEILRKKAYRPITAKESGKLQGFPNWFSIDKEESAAKKQFGNAVSTSVIYYLAQALISTQVFDNDARRKGADINKI